jgi:hypothetical protein
MEKESVEPQQDRTDAYALEIKMVGTNSLSYCCAKQLKGKAPRVLLASQLDTLVNGVLQCCSFPMRALNAHRQ